MFNTSSRNGTGGTREEVKPCFRTDHEVALLTAVLRELWEFQMEKEEKMDHPRIDNYALIIKISTGQTIDPSMVRGEATFPEVPGQQKFKRCGLKMGQQPTEGIFLARMFTDKRDY